MGIGDDLEFRTGTEIKHHSVLRVETPVVSTAAAYSANDSLFTEPMRVPNASRARGFGGQIEDLVIFNKDSVRLALALHLFKQDPGDETANSAYSVAYADMVAHQYGTIYICASDWLDVQNGYLAMLPKVKKEFYTDRDNDSRDIWIHGQVLEDASQAFSNTDGLTFKFSIRQY